MTLRGGTAHRGYSVVVFVVLASLDNVAIGLVPPLYGPIAGAFGVVEGCCGLVTAITFLVSAVAAVGWAYVGDRTNRKPLLMVGTLIWAAGTGGTALADGYPTFLAAQLVAAVGLGAVGVGRLLGGQRPDLAPPAGPGDELLGAVAGRRHAGRDAARRPARRDRLAAPVPAAHRGRAGRNPGLPVHVRHPARAERAGAGRGDDAGAEYDYRISRADLPRILGRRTNVWLILQGLTAQVAFGSLVWLPGLFGPRAEAQGYSRPPPIVVGSVFATLFQLGGVLSIVGGLVGDRLQRRTPRGRALVAAVGILAAMPFYLVLFFVPMRIDVPDGAGAGAVVGPCWPAWSREPTVAAAPGHRGGGAGPDLGQLAELVRPDRRREPAGAPGHRLQPRQPGQRGRPGRRQRAGRGGLPRALRAAFPPPLNYAVGLAAFQLFFIPTGSCTGSPRGPSPATWPTCTTCWSPGPGGCPPGRGRRRDARDAAGSGSVTRLSTCRFRRPTAG